MRHALQPVDLLHLVQQVLLDRPRPLDEQDVVWVHRALGEAVARPSRVGCHAVGGISIGG